MLLSFKEKNKVLEKYIENEKRLGEIFEKEEVNLEELLELVKDITKKPISNISFVKEKELNPKLLEAYSKFSQEISSLEKQDTLDLSLIISFLNLFEELIKSEKRFEVPETNPIILTRRESYPLILKNNRKIILTDSSFNLSDFTCDELIEILRVLDVVIIDNRYDNLRTEIAKQIESISSVSISK